MADDSLERLMRDREAPHPLEASGFTRHESTVEMREQVDEAGRHVAFIGTEVEGVYNPHILALIAILCERVSILEDVVRTLTERESE